MAPAAGKSKKKSKRKVNGVGIDFKKVKHKVGRKLAPAKNVTKVDFKSKAIVLPGQNVGQERDGLAVNQRNKSLKELFNQTAHYSERVRKDALIGIKDLFLRHPKELEVNALTTIQKLSSRFVDVDKAVRHALIVVLRSIFPNISKEIMKPLIPFVMAHLGSAMTNMANEVRLSAFSFLDLLLQHYPTLLVPSFTSQILEYYDHFLKNGGRGNLDSSAMLTVLSSLSRFLSVVSVSSSSKTRRTTSSIHIWSQKFDTQKSLQGSAGGLCALHGYKTMVEDVAEDDHFTCSIDGEASWSKWLGIVSSIVEALLNCWAQSAPAVCSNPLPDAVCLDSMVSITKCLCLLFEWLETSSDVYQVRLELRKRYMSSCSVRLMGSFPVSAPSIRTVSKMEDSLSALNAGICETMLHFLVPISPEEDSTRFDVILQYYENALSGQLLPSSVLSFHVIQNKAAEPYVKSLMAFIPSVFECASMIWKSRLLQVLTQVFENSSARSNTASFCLPVILKILLSDQKGAHSSISEQYTKQWLQSFPRLLWELKHTQPSASKTILETLLCLGKSAIAGSILAAEFERLQPSMIPFFSSILPTKQGKEKILFGPFLKLPKDCQEIAVDTLFYFRKFQPPFLKAVSTCCSSTDIDLHILTRLVEVIERSCAQGSVEVVHFLSFVLTLIVETSSREGGISWNERHTVTLAVVCRSLSRVGDGQVILDLLAKAMSEHLVDRGSPVLCASFMRIIASVSQDLGEHGHLEIPESLLNVLPAKAATFMISEYLAKHNLARFILRTAIVLLYRNKQFGKSLMKEFARKLSGGQDQMFAVGVLTTEVCKQEGVAQHIDFVDVRDILRAAKETLKQQPEMRQVFHLETAIRSAFGSEV